MPFILSNDPLPMPFLQAGAMYLNSIMPTAEQRALEAQMKFKADQQTQQNWMHTMDNMVGIGRQVLAQQHDKAQLDKTWDRRTQYMREGFELEDKAWWERQQQTQQNALERLAFSNYYELLGITAQQEGAAWRMWQKYQADVEKANKKVEHEWKQNYGEFKKVAPGAVDWLDAQLERMKEPVLSYEQFRQTLGATMPGAQPQLPEQIAPEQLEEYLFQMEQQDPSWGTRAADWKQIRQQSENYIQAQAQAGMQPMIPEPQWQYEAERIQNARTALDLKKSANEITPYAYETMTGLLDKMDVEVQKHKRMVPVESIGDQIRKNTFTTEDGTRYTAYPDMPGIAKIDRKDPPDFEKTQAGRAQKAEQEQNEVEMKEWFKTYNTAIGAGDEASEAIRKANDGLNGMQTSRKKREEMRLMREGKLSQDRMKALMAEQQQAQTARANKVMIGWTMAKRAQKGKPLRKWDKGEKLEFLAQHPEFGMQDVLIIWNQFQQHVAGMEAAGVVLTDEQEKQMKNWLESIMDLEALIAEYRPPEENVPNPLEFYGTVR